MQVEVRKTKMTDEIIKSIVEIDKEFYSNFDYDDLSWYFERYSDKNEIFLLLVGGKIVGYFLFIEISKRLFDDILGLKYDNDYAFPVKDLNKKSGYFYISSVIVKKKYRRFALPLLKRLFLEAKTKENLAVITVSKQGHRMASKLLDFVGTVDPKKDIRVYKKTFKGRN